MSMSKMSEFEGGGIRKDKRNRLVQVRFLHVGNSALYIISITLIMYVNTEIAFNMHM